MADEMELLAGEAEKVKAVLAEPKLQTRYKNATMRVVPHEGRPGVSVYGNANWKTGDEVGNASLSAYLQGLYDGMKD